MKNEEWRAVVGFEGRYEVSSLGRVRSLDRVIECPHWDKYAKVPVPTTRKLKGRMLRPGPTKSGHLTVSIGRRNSRLVHHLVLEAFIGPRPDGCESLHADDVPSNNTPENLSWGTRSQNLYDAVRNGKKPVGEAHPGAILTEKTVLEIRRRAKTERPSHLGRIFGIAESHVRDIRDRKTWKYLPEETAT